MWFYIILLEDVSETSVESVFDVSFADRDVDKIASIEAQIGELRNELNFLKVSYTVLYCVSSKKILVKA